MTVNGTNLCRNSMRSRNKISWLLLVLVVELLTTAPAHAFYNPQTGRWLSRDPLGERGGLNLYCFIANSPVKNVDLFGLTGPATWCKFCKCDQVTVTGLFPLPTMGWYLKPGTTINKYGNLLTIRWDIIGDPKKCSYGQHEYGAGLALPKSKPNLNIKGPDFYGDHPSVPVDSYGLHSATYQDSMGAEFFGPDKGEWALTIKMKIEFTCTSSTGKRITGHVEDFNEDLDITF